jgi:hypothetical protein
MPPASWAAALDGVAVGGDGARHRWSEVLLSSAPSLETKIFCSSKEARLAHLMRGSCSAPSTSARSPSFSSRATVDRPLAASPSRHNGRLGRRHTPASRVRWPGQATARAAVAARPLQAIGGGKPQACLERGMPALRTAQPASQRPVLDHQSSVRV